MESVQTEVSVRQEKLSLAQDCEHVVNMTLEQWLGIAVMTASFKMVLSFLNRRNWVWILSSHNNNVIKSDITAITQILLTLVITLLLYFQENSMVKIKTQAI